MTSYIKTIFLLGVLSAVLIGLGGLLGGREGIYTALAFALLINGISYFYSDKIAIAASGAKPVSKHQAPEFYEVVGDLARHMHLPMPKLFVIPAPQANAFATGRNPHHASVAVTEGLLQLLPKEEIKAVLAHELAHIKNRDILVASVAAVLASAISFVANMSLFSTHDEEEGSNPLFTLIAALFVPIAASLIQLAVSRQREFGADQTGAKVIGKGEPLAKALLIIHQSAQRAPLALNPAYSSLYIENPLGKVNRSLLNLFSTHPDVHERVKRLRAIT